MSLRQLIACALLLSATAARAAVIDFETLPLGGAPTDDQNLPFLPAYNVAGILVSFGFDTDSNGSVESPAVFEHVGLDPLEPPNAGFSGSAGTDTADGPFTVQLGNWFLRGPASGQNFGKFVIQYSSLLPTAASGEIWDIDGNQMTGTTEQYTVQAFDTANNLLATTVSPLGVLDTPIAPLDGKPWTFGFSGLTAGIDHIVVTFTGTKPAGIGLAFNNFNPTGVPEPGTATIAAGLIAASASLRRRFRTHASR